MKKLLLFFSLLIFIVGCSSNSVTEGTQTETFGYSTLEGKTHIIHQVSVADIKKMLEDKESFFLMIGRPSCSHCVEAIPEYTTIAQKHGLEKIYYFSFEEMVQEFDKNGELSEQSNKDFEYLTQKFGFEGSTPVFYFVKDGTMEVSSDQIIGIKLPTWTETLEKMFTDNRLN